MNIFAGLQLKKRKVIKEPKKNQSNGVEDVEYKAAHTGAMQEEATSPSSPSVKLMRLTNKTIRTTAKKAIKNKNM